jgi:hypothetical protein
MLKNILEKSVIGPLNMVMFKFFSMGSVRDEILVAVHKQKTNTYRQVRNIQIHETEFKPYRVPNGTPVGTHTLFYQYVVPTGHIKNNSYTEIL